MNLERKRIRLGGMGVALFGTLLVAACETDNVTDLTADRPVLKVVLAPGDAVYPSGSVALSKAVVSGFDFSVSDAFGRATGPDGFFGDVDYGSGAAPGVNMGGAVRNASQDPRLPALKESSAVVGSHFGMFERNLFDARDIPVGYWDMWGVVQGLEPSTTYSVVLARMTLQVNGMLDHNAVLTGVPVSEPDRLTFAPGEVTSHDEVVCNYSAFSPVSAEMNPVVLGTIESDADGNATVDCILQIQPGDLWPGRAEGADFSVAADFTAASTPFGSNEPGAMVNAGQFNYLLLYEGAPNGGAVVNGNPTVRLQLGPDIDASGNAVNNAMAPFPTDVVPNAPDLPGGANAFSAPGQIDVTLTGFSPLSGGSYQLWLHDRSSGSYAPAEGAFSMMGDDDMMMMGSTFSPMSPEDVYQAKLDAAMSMMDFGAYSHVAVSAEPSAGSAPSSSPFLFQEYLTSDNIMQQGGMTFGRMADDGALQPFVTAGSGTISFYETSMLVDLRRLPAPPPGLHYQSYLATFTGPSISSSARLHTVTLDNRGNGADRVEESEAGSFGSYTHYLLVLEPDGIESITEMRVQQSDDYKNEFKEFFGN